MQATPARSSPNAPSTSDPAGSSDATATAATNASTPWTITASDKALETLTPRSRSIRILIAERMVDGYEPSEIATELGVSTSWVSERLDDLRNELILSAGRFFPLTDQEYASLRQSIIDHGVQTPIVIGRHIALIDGRHRCLISRELGLADIPAVFVLDKTPSEEHELSVALNAARRQLNQAQKRALIRAELTRDATRSDTRIAAVCGVDHKTVGTLRAEMATEARADATYSDEQTLETTMSGNPFEPDTRIDTLGRAQPARTRVAHGETTDSAKPLGNALCCHGQRHAILRDGDGYRLEAR